MRLAGAGLRPPDLAEFGVSPGERHAPPHGAVLRGVPRNLQMLRFGHRCGFSPSSDRCFHPSAACGGFRWLNGGNSNKQIIRGLTLLAWTRLVWTGECSEEHAQFFQHPRRLREGCLPRVWRWAVRFGPLLENSMRIPSSVFAVAGKTLALLVVAGSIIILSGQKSADKKLGPHVNTLLASQAAVQYVNPGLTFSVVSAKIASDGTISVRSP